MLAPMRKILRSILEFEQEDDGKILRMLLRIMVLVYSIFLLEICENLTVTILENIVKEQ